MNAAEVVREFWRLVATNDFHAVKAVLAPDLAQARRAYADGIEAATR